MLEILLIFAPKFNKDMAELRIKEILKERNMTSKSLAESMGKAPQYISNVINGGKGVSINSLEEIARHLDVPISSLFADYNFSNGASNQYRCPHCGKELRIKIE